MKIVQVASYFSPHVGGIETHVRELSFHLSEAGHEVSILTTNVPRSKREEKVGRVEVLRFDAPLRPMGNPLAIGMLKGLLAKRDFDIVHCHDEHSFTSNMAALAHSIHDQRLIISCHGRLAYTTPLKKTILKMYEGTLMLATIKSAEATICLSPSDKIFLNTLGVSQDRIHTIPNAINLPLSTSFQKKKSEEKVVLCVSQLLQRKGIETLVDAMREVHRVDKNVKLVIIGEGERRAELEIRTRKSGLDKVIVFKGKTSNEEVERAYGDCDLFVLPSFAEGLPTVILEAMARERAVVATDILGVRDYFSEAAILVPPGDSRRFVEAILGLLGDEDLRKRLGRKGRELVERRFTWDIVARQIVDLYERVLRH